MESLTQANHYLRHVETFSVIGSVSDPRIGFGLSVNLALQEGRIIEKDAQILFDQYKSSLPQYYFRGALYLSSLMQKNHENIRLEYLSPFWQYLKKAKLLGYSSDDCEQLGETILLLIKNIDQIKENL